jgi:epoxide hydrolase 4
MISTLPITHRTISTNNIRLHVAEMGDPQGELVILLHGFPEFWYGWRAQMPALAEAGFHVLAPDQRGYNLSDKPRGVAAYALDTLAADILGIIDAEGREKVYLAGHDWGAIVAWWLAISYPDRLHKLAILNVPHPAVFMRHLRSNPTQILKSWYGAVFQIPWLPEQMMLANNAASVDILRRTSNPGSFRDIDLAAYREAWQQPGAATAMFNWYRAFVQQPPTLPHNPRVHVPTRILWGVNDVALSREMGAESATYCDNGEVVWFEKATHWVQHDEPARVNESLLDFFADK